MKLTKKDERQNDKDNEKRNFEDDLKKCMDKYKGDKKEIDLTIIQRSMGTKNVNIREYYKEEEER